MRLAAVCWLCLIAPAWAGPPERVHHELDIGLEPQARHLSVIDRIDIDGGDAIDLRLAPGLTVERIEIDGRTVPDRSALRLDGGRHRIRIDYAGTLAPIDAEGRGDGPASGAKGSYLPGGSGWLPPIDAERLSYRLTVQVPTGYRAVATGGLVEEQAGASGYRAVYAADPAVEEPSLFAGQWDVRERQVDGRRLRTYLESGLEPDLAGLADDYLGLSADMIDRFSRRIGPYPFDGFAILSAPLPVGLGFPGLTYIGRQVLPLPFIRTQSLPHEILHNWWGNGVLVDYDHGNWSEGLTSYMADYALTAERSADAGREMRLGWLRDYAALPADRDQRLDRFTAKIHDAAQVIGYNKSAFLFLMLEDRLGTERFDAGLRHFWERHRLKRASWSDLQAAFAAASGEDLSRFFDQWLTRPGAPNLHLDGAKVRQSGAGFTLDVTVSQDEPTYRLRIPVAIDSAGGRIERTLDLTDTSATLTVELPDRPTRAALDPDYRLFRRLAAGEAPPILRDVTLDPATQVVVASSDPKAADTARELAGRLLDAGGQLVSADAARLATGAPLAIIGTTPDVGRTLAGLGLPPVPDPLTGRGTARVWTLRRDTGRPVLAIAADDPAALEALLRPLPHYGRQSFLVFNGRQAIDRGVWPAGDSALSRAVN
jgi:aminopeptidase N